MNIDGVRDLVESGVNKVNSDGESGEGLDGEYVDILELPMSDEELLGLRESWLSKSDPYDARIKPRQNKNKLYYSGRQQNNQDQTDSVVSSNLIFEAEETFIPQALSKNPEPVVWSDNTDQGKDASNDVKTMLQYHADVLCLRKKLGVMVRHWSIYFVGIVKHGWEEHTVGDKTMGDIITEIRKPQNFILDPDGYVDEYGNYIGDYLGERIESTAEKLCELFPKFKNEIMLKVNNKAGTKTIRTEWWTDNYCFTTFEDWVLEKHKNEYFNYDTTEESEDEYGEITQTATPGVNHFARPKMPYTFLSVFSLQERPHDITNLIEQNISNQDRINERDVQITRNLRAGNNSIAVSGLSFTSETARQAAQALEDGDPVLVPDGQVENGIKRLPANDLPGGILQAQENDKTTLRSVFGTLGLSASQQNENTTARGEILNQNQDSSRIGGGIGDALEQVADNIFNWWLQLYCVFYDEEHYGAVMGSDQAVEYVALVNSDLTRKFVVSVAPNSMQPKDEVTEQNLAISLWDAKALDPISLFKKLNYPDPMETAKMVTLWTTNPQLYAATYFPEQQQAPNSANPQTGQQMPPQQGTPPPTLAAPDAGTSLSQVPISTPAMPQ